MAWATVSRTVSVGMGQPPAVLLGARPRLPGPAVEHDRLGLGHLGHGGAWSLLADAAALEAAVGHEVGAPQRGPVDVDAAGVDLAHGLDGAGHVTGEDARGQAVAGAVGLGDGCVPVLGRADGDGRANSSCWLKG